MKVEQPTIGQIIYRAELLVNGQDVDGEGEDYTTREEAEQDGEELAAWYDPEWQKRNPDAVEYYVREWKVDSIDPDGTWGGYTTD